MDSSRGVSLGFKNTCSSSFARLLTFYSTASFMLQSEPTFAVPNQEVGAPR